MACFCVILSMYGGGFATIPAYLADVFGTKYVSAVHGRLLTAWSAAGVLGPVLVNYIRQFQIDHGIPKNQAYNVTMYIMAGLLVIALLRQPGGEAGRRALPRAHRPRSAGRATAACRRSRATAWRRSIDMTTANAESGSHATNVIKLALAWLAVGMPLALGRRRRRCKKAMALFAP